MGFVSRGFRGKRRDTVSGSRVPPGQHVVTDFPVLSAGPTPRVRCPGCEQVPMRMVHGRGRYWVDLSGTRCREFIAPD